jgi:Gram-negative bacterial TonB protein C-terminal
MWDVALKLFPDLKPSALKRYGEVAEILSAEHPSRRDLDSEASEEETDVNPEIISSSGEFTLVYSALEAMGKWTFKPATLHGEPVPVFFNETIRFRVP